MAANIFSVIGILLCLYLAILYQSTAACAVFLFLVLYGTASFLQLWYLSGKIKTEILQASATKSQDREIAFALSVKNTGILPLFRGCILLTVQDLQGQVCQTQKLYFSVKSRQEIRPGGTLESPCCGRFLLLVKAVRLYSFGHLFSRKLSQDCPKELLFYPKITSLPLTVSEQVRYFSAESGEEEQILPGIFQTPVNQVRDFRPGDRVRQIHWKLSARTDSLLVRDMGIQQGFPVLLFLFIEPLPDKDFTASYRRFLETAVSLSFSLLQSGCRHFVIWYHHREEKLIRFPIRREEDLDLCTYCLLLEDVKPVPGDICELYRQQYPSDTFCTTLLLHTRLEFYKNGQPENLESVPSI